MMKYFTATLAFLFIFVATAILCAVIMNMLFPPGHDLIHAGIGLDWHSLPGTILGIAAGLHSARVSLRKGSEREARLQRKI